MKIVRHRLCRDDGTAYPFVRSPNISGKVTHEYLVIHYTAGRTSEGAVSWLTNRASRASAHLVIDRNGEIMQLVPFDRMAWHAGVSSWEGRFGLNRYSLGLELDNAGRLTRKGENWRAWFQHEYAQESVLQAVHTHGRKSYGWHLYPPEQIEATLEVAQLLVTHYSLRDVVGHDDISPRRKWDPGPAFPMESFRARIVGRAEEVPLLFEATTGLNIRTGPGTQHPTISGSPLPKGTPVEIIDEDGSWRFVDVLVEVREIMDMQGWVHGRYLKRIDIRVEE
jgi:N-acetylmuramoyl-L-alanine amidase